MVVEEPNSHNAVLRRKASKKRHSFRKGKFSTSSRSNRPDNVKVNTNTASTTDRSDVAKKTVKAGLPTMDDDCVQEYSKHFGIAVRRKKKSKSAERKEEFRSTETSAPPVATFEPVNEAKKKANEYDDLVLDNDDSIVNDRSTYIGSNCKDGPNEEPYAICPDSDAQPVATNVNNEKRITEDWAVQHEADKEKIPTVFEEIQPPSRPAICRKKESKLQWKPGHEPDKDKNPTIFEEIQEPARPAVCREKSMKLQWKKGCEPEKKSSRKSSRRRSKMHVVSSAEQVNGRRELKTTSLARKRDPQFLTACKIMVQVRQNNILETILKANENQLIRKYFEGDRKEPSQQVFSLLNRALSMCCDELLFNQGEYDVLLDEEMRGLLLVKDTARNYLLEAILYVPALVPLLWGGTHVHIQSWESEESVSSFNRRHEIPGVKDGKHKYRPPDPSPWSELMKKAIEDERNKEIAAGKRKSGTTTTTSTFLSPHPSLPNQ